MKAIEIVASDKRLCDIGGMKVTAHKIHSIQNRVSLTDGRVYRVGFVKINGKRQWVWHTPDSFGGGWLRVTVVGHFRGINP